MACEPRFGHVFWGRCTAHCETAAPRLHSPPVSFLLWTDQQYNLVTAFLQKKNSVNTEAFLSADTSGHVDKVLTGSKCGLTATSKSSARGFAATELHRNVVAGHRPENRSGRDQGPVLPSERGGRKGKRKKSRKIWGLKEICVACSSHQNQTLRFCFLLTPLLLFVLKKKRLV